MDRPDAPDASPKRRKLDEEASRSVCHDSEPVDEEEPTDEQLAQYFAHTLGDPKQMDDWNDDYDELTSDAQQRW